MNRKNIDVVIYQVPKFEDSPLATVRFTEYDGHGRAVKVNEVDYWDKEYFHCQVLEAVGYGLDVAICTQENIRVLQKKLNSWIN
nr:hypothetical protein [uncultured Mediterranean phage uvMED]